MAAPNRYIFSFVFLLISLCPVMLFSQQSYLSRKISVKCDNCTMQNALKEIGNAGQFRFSYNAAMIQADKKVDVLAINEQAGTVLRRMLGRDVSMREVGNHVILVNNKQQEKITEEWEIKGNILDTDGNPLKDATIYEISRKRSAISGKDGRFMLVLPQKKPGDLNISKRGFEDTVIFIRPNLSQFLTIRLKTVPTVYHLSSAPAELTGPMSDTMQLVRWIVPRETMINSQNLEDRTTRTFQASIIPYIGTNWRITGSVTNRFSLNLLAGYTGGLKGVEIGGLLNITARNTGGLQVGGLANVVGGSGKGVQIGGLTNYDLGKFNGVEIAGLLNYSPDTLSGVQIAGLSNWVPGTVEGVQVAGLFNTVTGNCDAYEIAGLCNYVVKDSRKMQISGLLNYAKNARGLQLSGLVNVAALYNEGVQIAGVLNYTSHLKGVQIALFNIAVTHERGIPIGLFSWVSDGYHLAEISGNEIFYGNIAYKSGTRSLYNFFQFGMGSDYKMQGSYGLGTMVSLGKKFSTSFDASAGFVYHPTGTVYHGLLLKAYPALEYRPAKHFALFAGPSWNFFLFPKGDPSATSRGLSNYDFYFKSTENASIQMWIGGVAGIRL